MIFRANLIVETVAIAFGTVVGGSGYVADNRVISDCLATSTFEPEGNPHKRARHLPAGLAEIQFQHPDFMARIQLRPFSMMREFENLDAMAKWLSNTSICTSIFPEYQPRGFPRRRLRGGSLSGGVPFPKPTPEQEAEQTAFKRAWRNGYAVAMAAGGEDEQSVMLFRLAA